LFEFLTPISVKADTKKRFAKYAKYVDPAAYALAALRAPSALCPSSDLPAERRVIQ